MIGTFFVGHSKIITRGFCPGCLYVYFILYRDDFQRYSNFKKNFLLSLQIFQCHISVREIYFTRPRSHLFLSRNPINRCSSDTHPIMPIQHAPCHWLPRWDRTCKPCAPPCAFNVRTLCEGVMYHKLCTRRIWDRTWKPCAFNVRKLCDREGVVY